ncbi:MAG: argininosuccinate lyase [Veillonellaceae bacterium]|nr:argininosuccinate lyase [Veillonellaceae bacterium]
MKLWGGRFTENTAPEVEEFTSSIGFDRRLYREDIAGSIAHATMLAEQGIISPTDAKAIREGLTAILQEIEAGKFSFSVALEDIHMNLESALTERIGEAGKRLHTARSRNDQVALDMHLYMRRAIVAVGEDMLYLLTALRDVAQEHAAVIMPGYTHLQRAQPILLAHHLLAYFAMLARDFRRLAGCWVGADMMPLGAGALAGTSYPTKPERVAELLQFGSLYGNSMDAVSDRDYLLEFQAMASITMMHLSRLSEEIILWASSEYRFIELSDAFCTGSSIMPQKKNPDVSELVRGKTGRVYGHFIALATVLKGLPLAYNKDLQEDKEGVFDTVDTLRFSLRVYADMLRSMRVHSERMRAVLEDDFSNATDLADYLAKKGLPFREAHAVVGRAVQYCVQHDCVLHDLDLATLQRFSPLFAEDILAVLAIENVVAVRSAHGGTAPVQVERQLQAAAELLSAYKEEQATRTARVAQAEFVLTK